jgi:hypothetical protein
MLYYVTLIHCNEFYRQRNRELTGYGSARLDGRKVLLFRQSMRLERKGGRGEEEEEYCNCYNSYF